MFAVASVETALVLCQILPPAFVHDVTWVKPVMIGFGPEPYAEKVIRCEDDPAFVAMIEP
jgi:hypothetical protein